jgi:hypothetical protein
MKTSQIALLLTALTACGPSTTQPAPAAEPETTAAPAPPETSVPVATAEPAASASASATAQPGSHSGGPAVCEEIAKACHDVGHGPGETGKCHELGHKGDATVCEKEHHRCLALCAEAAKKGGGHHAH